MHFALTLLQNNALTDKLAVDEIVQMNDISRKFGLTLTPSQAQALVATRRTALAASGRVEFGGGVLDKLIFAFCDSPYIQKQDYEQTLHDLTELFYYYKNETDDCLSDDELIAFMKTSFDGECAGSIELLASRQLHNLAQNLRRGTTEEQEDSE